MPLTRWIVSSNDSAASPAKNAIVNTLFFNVSGAVGQDPDYTSLGNDLYNIVGGLSCNSGRYLDIRAYDMADAQPRPIKWQKKATPTGTAKSSPHQVALCLSYYADRNIGGSRGRLYFGPWTTSGTNASDSQTTELIGLATAFAALGGINVDWTLYSPKKGQGTRITNAWVDDSWDIIRSRKVASVAPRKVWSGNG